jgi:hypothetical protein
MHPTSHCYIKLEREREREREEEEEEEETPDKMKNEERREDLF